MRVLTFLLALVFVCGCAERKVGPEREKERIADRITKKVATELRTERELIPCGSGGGMMHEIRMLALSFDYRKPLDVETGRELLVAAIQKYLSEINSNEQIRPFLLNYPFEAKNIQIRIFWNLTSELKNDPQQLCDVTAMDGILRYDVYDAPRHLKTIYEETYEEAVQKLQGID